VKTPEAQARSSQPIRILLVDDDPQEVAQVRDLFASADENEFELADAARLEDALRLLLEERFDVVLLDLGLEESEGLDTLGRARVAAASVPFIVMSAEDDESLALRAHRFGAQDYLVKGTWEPRLVQRTVRHALERHRILADLARSRQHEHYLATHDGLTGLPNRLAIMDQLHRTLAQSARGQRCFAVLFVDLDRFKQINDSMGHPVGDDVLSVIAERLSQVLRRSDMVARLGGDEFIILLPDIKRPENAAVVAQKITESVSAPCHLGSGEYRVTASIGIAVFPGDGQDPDVLIRNADTAMYAAKAEGPNRFSFYAEGMNERVRRRLALENGLRAAVERGSFRMHFQPQVELVNGTAVGVEALLRWHSPDRGLLGPAEFIAVAEEAGLIRSLGIWSLRAACEAAREWRGPSGEPLRLAVNLSARQLADRDFPSALEALLRDLAFDPRRLDLEIGEHGALRERETWLQMLAQLRHQLGVRVVIDDFGSGTSALAALRHLPVDGLKIGRDFVASILEDAADATITSGLLTIARGLSLPVTACGVETPEQRDFLYEHGCSRMQGFLFAKPMEAQELAALLAAEAPPWDGLLPEPPAPRRRRWRR
jgi:diguanylate cyclase (GGDEF)-like protein